ncbi:MAG: ATP-binding protein [Spirochaetales bacterium]|jgi:uncharacterized protein|nr:ATP-binding protein [Spirochaetales bacterium]
MTRIIIADLIEWKQNIVRKKPLVLKGARQVGKTWVLREFGKNYYEKEGHSTHYVDFRESKRFHSIFQETSNPGEIIKLLEFQLRRHIDTANDLLIFDEIQECPEAITSFKYFEQNLKELDIIAAGSHMGLMKNEEAFPVGKVNFLYMFPMNFGEFVLEIDPNAYHYLDNFDFETPLQSVVHERLLELFTVYSLTGGLPEVINAFLEKWPGDVRAGALAARKVQEDLIVGYRADFAKYSGVVNATHINYVFDSIPSQLSKAFSEGVKKFQFKNVIPGRKGFDSLRGPLSWLIESRLCIKSSIANKAAHPLTSYYNENKFKVFLFDIGILNGILNIPCDAILSEKLGTYKGFMLENFVAQELFSQTNRVLISWTEGTAELEFLINSGTDIIPVEVKSAARNRRSKSLDAFIDRYSPPKAIKLSRQNLGENLERKISSWPVYIAYKLMERMQFLGKH